MKILKNILTFAAIYFTLVIPSNAGTIEDIVKRGELRVGLSTFVPWAFVDNTGKLVGFEIDVATQLAKDLGVKLKVVNTAWDGIIPALQSKKFDVIIGGMSVTTKRNVAVNFSDGYGGAEYTIITTAENKKRKIKEFNSRKFTFASRRGSVPALLIKKHFPKAKLLQFDDDGVADQELINSRVDAVVNTDVAASLVIAENKGKIFFVEKGKAIFSDSASFAIRKGDVDALNVFNHWIGSKRNEGWLKERSDYWFKTKGWVVELPK